MSALFGLNADHGRHMYIKTSPMQGLAINYYRYGYLENVKAVIVNVPLTKVLLESFFCTHAFLKR